MLIGWDAADWKIIDKLMAQGQMPTLKKFVEEGTRGNIVTLDPPLSPMLWTSIATGKTADKHGILGFVEPDPNSEGIRPVSSRSRKVKAVWNMLHQNDMRSVVVGWWPSNPVEPINGAMVSNFYQQERSGRDTIPMDEWEMPKGTVHPEKYIDSLKELRVHPHEITGNLVMPFAPKAVNIPKAERDKDKRLGVITKFLAHASSLHAATTELMEKEEWDFLAVYHDAIDHFSHAFMKYHPPKIEEIPQHDFELFGDVVNSIYRFHDMMLDRMLQLADDDTTVVIVSDHGFHSDHLRPKQLPDIPAGPALEHSPYGVFAVKGPGIKKGETIYGASILDVTPTLLSLFGLPVGEDMDGKPLTQIYEEENVEVDRIPSWEAVEGEDGSLPSEEQDDPWAAAAAMEQLIELGYIDAPSEDMASYRKNVINESNYYLAQTYMHIGKHSEALPILEELFDGGEGPNRFGMELIQCYQKTAKFEQGLEAIGILRERGTVNPDYLNFYEGRIYLGMNQTARAIQLFEKAYEKMPDSAEINFELGRVYNVIGEHVKAERCFLRVLARDPQNAYAMHGIGLSVMRQDRNNEALDHFLAAIDIRYFYPFAHYHLGECLMNLKEPVHAAQAFEVAVSMAPGLKKAYRWLVDLYDAELNDPAKRDHYQQLLNKHIKGSIVIVTGLPRSGTAMMMQALEAGGLPVFTDDAKAADEHNPNGYYEHSKALELGSDQAWLKAGNGKALKVKFSHLGSLPADYDYKFVVMERGQDALMQSLLKVTDNVLANRQDAFPAALAQDIEEQSAFFQNWVDRHPNIDLIRVRYEEMLKDPKSQALNVSSFLQKGLDVDRMAAVVDPTLNRSELQKN